MDNEREPEISEETLRLIRELGDRLEEDDSDSSSMPRFRARTFSARPISMARPSALAGSSLPEYLSRAGYNIMMGRPGAYWLHGEDARERLRAVDALAARLAAGGKLSWVTAVVNLSAGASRRQARVTNALELAVRRVWEAWEDLSNGGPDPSILAAAAVRSAASGGRAGVAIILAEFPARKKKATGFLDWLTSGMAMGSIPMLIFVSTESPPAAQHAPFEPVLCETHAVRMGRRIAALRLQRGWNRAELAERAGFPQSMITEIEGGLRERWDERVLLRVAEALGMTVDELENDRSEMEEA